MSGREGWCSGEELTASMRSGRPGDDKVPGTVLGVGR